MDMPENKKMFTNSKTRTVQYFFREAFTVVLPKGWINTVKDWWNSEDGWRLDILHNCNKRDKNNHKMIINKLLPPFFT